jgi:hypothetical protein
MNYETETENRIQFPAGDPEPETVIEALIRAIENEYLPGEYRSGLIRVLTDTARRIECVNSEFLG